MSEREPLSGVYVLKIEENLGRAKISGAHLVSESLASEKEHRGDGFFILSISKSKSLIAIADVSLCTGLSFNDISGKEITESRILEDLWKFLSECAAEQNPRAILNKMTNGFYPSYLMIWRGSNGPEWGYSICLALADFENKQIDLASVGTNTTAVESVPNSNTFKVNIPSNPRFFSPAMENNEAGGRIEIKSKKFAFDRPFLMATDGIKQSRRGIPFTRKVINLNNKREALLDSNKEGLYLIVSP